MNKTQEATDEVIISKTKEEIIKEAKRIEEDLLYSSKAHFVASSFWNLIHLAVGILIIVLSFMDWIVKNASTFSGIIFCVSTVVTFINPKQKAELHLKSGNNYNSLMSKVRIFRAIDCCEGREQILTEKIRYYSEQRNGLNRDSPQIPRLAYITAKKGIIRGEGKFLVDEKKFKNK